MTSDGVQDTEHAVDTVSRTCLLQGKLTAILLGRRVEERGEGREGGREGGRGGGKGEGGGEGEGKGDGSGEEGGESEKVRWKKRQ